MVEMLLKENEKVAFILYCLVIDENECISHKLYVLTAQAHAFVSDQLHYQLVDFCMRQIFFLSSQKCS